MNTPTPATRPLQITFREFSSTEALDGHVRGRAARLFELCPKVTSCHVVLEAPHQRHRHGPKFRCRIDLFVPHAELVAKSADQSDVSANVYAAIDEAFDEAVRQLEDHMHRARWDVKHHDGTPHARVAKLLDGEGPGTRYGFLETHDGREIYFHEHSVLRGKFDHLAVGTEVRFAEEDGDKGPQASTVVTSDRR